MHSHNIHKDDSQVFKRYEIKKELMSGCRQRCKWTDFWLDNC